MRRNIGMGIRDNRWDDIEQIGTIINFGEDHAFLDGFSIITRTGTGKGNVATPLPSERVCTSCHVLRPIEDFAIRNAKYPGSLAGRMTECKECRRTKMRDRYHRLANAGLFISRKHPIRGTGCTIQPQPQFRGMRCNRDKKQIIPDADLAVLLKYRLITIRGL